MITLSTIAFGLLSGFIGWMLTEFVAKPVRKGVDLIAEARTALIVYANVQARFRGHATNLDASLTPTDLPDEAEERLRAAERAFREISAKMQAFASTDVPAALAMRLLGVDFHEAGVAFMGLSNSIGIYGKGRHDAKARVEQALRLRFGAISGEN